MNVLRGKSDVTNTLLPGGRGWMRRGSYKLSSSLRALQVPSRSLEASLLPAAWQERVCTLVCGQDADNTAPRGTVLLYHQPLLIRLCAGSKELCVGEGST